MPDQSHKRCCKCGIEKTRADFRADKQKKDGLYSSCRECCKVKERARYAGDPDFRKWCADYRYRNPEVVQRNEIRQRTVNRDALLKRKREYQREAAARPEVQQKWAEYRKIHAAEIEARRKRWRQENPDRVREMSRGYAHIRRARSESSMTALDLAAWTKLQPKVCHWCDTKCSKNYHVDHYKPLSRGGLHLASNLVVACPTCNLRKHAKDPLEFAREVGRLF